MTYGILDILYFKDSMHNYKCS